jgi:bifunctional ADP-heptose synthase (sugar kinase/adenylyltransferase)
MILVIGDLISDYTRICRATRLCPEAPVPVLVQDEEYTTRGGAGLVVEQMREFLGDRVQSYFGSFSVKERIFADSHLVARIDSDRKEVTEWTKDLLKNIGRDILNSSAVVISDYDKGALTELGASYIVGYAIQKNIPVFVDSKKNWKWYEGAFAMFPNEQEGYGTAFPCRYIIRKMGAKGCMIDGEMIPGDSSRKVVDVTGAGDIFLASFVSRYIAQVEDAGVIAPIEGILRDCAKFANHVAGLSVEYVGTHVVKGIRY